eukprot:2223560-Amphidinium_carterae.1
MRPVTIPLIFKSQSCDGKSPLVYTRYLIDSRFSNRLKATSMMRTCSSKTASDAELHQERTIAISHPGYSDTYVDDTTNITVVSAGDETTEAATDATTACTLSLHRPQLPNQRSADLWSVSRARAHARLCTNELLAPCLSRPCTPAHRTVAEQHKESCQADIHGFGEPLLRSQVPLLPLLRGLAAQGRPVMRLALMFSSLVCCRVSPPKWELDRVVHIEGVQRLGTGETYDCVATVGDFQLHWSITGSNTLDFAMVCKPLQEHGQAAFVMGTKTMGESSCKCVVTSLCVMFGMKTSSIFCLCQHYPPQNCRSNAGMSDLRAPSWGATSCRPRSHASEAKCKSGD